MKSLFGEELPTVINVAAVRHRSPFRYPGGKTWLVPFVRRWLASLPQRPSMIGEPFAGGAIVGLSALFDELADSLAIVEIDEDVAAVWHEITCGNANQLADRIVSFQMTKASVKSILSSNPTSRLDRAFAAILRNRVQRGGIMAPGATLMKKGENGKGIASRWYAQTLSKRIKAIGERRNRIIFLQSDGINFIRANSHRADMAFFIDPPYTVAGRRLYVHSDIDHRDLFGAVAKIKGSFLMSYDNVEPIRKLAKTFDFATLEVPMKNTHHAVLKELLISKSFAAG